MSTYTFGQSVIQITDNETQRFIGKSIHVLEDPTGELTLEEVKTIEFTNKELLDVPNLGVTNSAFWVKFTVQNLSNSETIWINLEQPTLDRVDFYSNNSTYSLQDKTPIKERPITNQNYVFPIRLDEGASQLCYIRVQSGDQIQLPISIGTPQSVQAILSTKDMYFSLYAGIMLAMILSAILIFIKTKDKNYFLYVGYIVIVFLAQANFQGYSLRYIWPNNTGIERYGVYILSALAGISGSLFIMQYISTKVNARWSTKFFYAVFIIYPFAIIPIAFGYFNIAYNILQMIATVSALLVLAVAFYCWRKGVQQAGNLLIAWGIFMVGIVVFVLKDFGIVTFNDFTYNIMTIGSALEGILLSFGLADKINVLKREKEEAQRREIEALKVNEKELEERVQMRTKELELAEKKATNAYKELVISQKQLVESEKLAGLGQMTAGIAHELNNPINFVTSNVGPLQRDVEDVIQILDEFADLPPDTSSEEWKVVRHKYDQMQIPYIKKEIEMLLKGIEEGSHRTAEIVKGMRIFARADKDTLVSANINDCINSTLIVMKSAIKGQVTLHRSIDMNLPMTDCYPGKLNQAIVNLISNAIQATKMEGRKADQRVVEVSSYFDEQAIHISVKDNGPGIDESIKNRIFDPFFTTKQVGEGTGLGLSIAMGIVEEHKGYIEVITTPNIGSEFIIHLPRTQKSNTKSAA